jgi:hypothetical protein
MMMRGPKFCSMKRPIGIGEAWFAIFSTPSSDRGVLGERCFRFEDSHRHGRSSQCITADGLVLKHSSSDMEGYFNLAAVKLDRGLVTLNAVQPPPFIFATKTWGIPDQ